MTDFHLNVDIALSTCVCVCVVCVCVCMCVYVFRAMTTNHIGVRSGEENRGH